MGSGLIGLLLFVCGLGLTWFAYTKWNLLGLIRKKETRSIGSLAGGFAEIKGRIVPLQTELSPYSGEPCVYFDFIVEEYRQTGSGKNRRSSWRTICSGKRCHDFLIDDGTGKARIQAHGAAFHLNVDAHGRSGTFNSPTPQLQDLLNRVGVSSTTFLGFNKSIRVKETFLSPGDQMYILGFARPDRDPSSGAKVVVAKDPAAPAFIVSDKSEEELSSSIRNTALVISFFAGALLIAGPVVAVVVR